MEEQLVSLEVAKLLKEKGFDEDCLSSYSIMTGEEFSHNTTRNSKYIVWSKDDYCTTCTQSLVQKWIRETHEVIVLVDFDVTEAECFWSNIYVSGRLAKQTNSYAKYEDALEEGLLAALKLI